MEQEAAFALPVSVARGGSRQPRLTWLRFRLVWRRMKAPLLASPGERAKASLSPHLWREDKGRGKRGWSEPPTQRSEMLWGHQTHYSKAFVGAICFTIRHCFKRDGRAWFGSFQWELHKSVIDIQHYTFWCTKSPSILLKLKTGIENPIWSISNVQHVFLFFPSTQRLSE